MTVADFLASDGSGADIGCHDEQATSFLPDLHVGQSVALASTMRSLTAAKRHHCLSRSLEPTASAQFSPRYSEEHKQLQLKVKHLRKEVQSLRDVYSKQMSVIEQRCERQLQEKEDERREWWKEKKGEILRMQACIVIMQALYQKKKRDIVAKEQQQRESHAEKEAEFQAHLQQLEEAAAARAEAVEKEAAEKAGMYQKKIDELLQDRLAVEQRIGDLEGDVAKWRSEFERANLQTKSWQDRVEALKQEVRQASKVEELARKDAHIEALEAELRQTRKQIRESRHSEAEGVRKELMECVKFIAQILPDEWRARGVAVGAMDQLPQNLRQHLEIPAGAAHRLGSAGDEATRSAGHGSGQLPPVGSQTWPLGPGKRTSNEMPRRL